jgi:hypothetical protein
MANRRHGCLHGWPIGGFGGYAASRPAFESLTSRDTALAGRMRWNLRGMKRSRTRATCERSGRHSRPALPTDRFGYG